MSSESVTASTPRSGVLNRGEAIIASLDLLSLFNALSQQLSEQIAQGTNKVSEEVASVKSERASVKASVKTEISSVRAELSKKLEDSLSEIKTQVNDTNKAVGEVRKKVNELEETKKVGQSQRNARVDSVEDRIDNVESDLGDRISKNTDKINTLDMFVQQENEIKKSEIQETKDSLGKKINQCVTNTELVIKEDVRNLSQKVTSLQESVVTSKLSRGSGFNWVNIVVKTYPGDGKIHPQDFLHRCSDNFTFDMTDGLKIKFIKKFLDNEAFTWVNQINVEGMTYSEFERSFFNKFWSKIKQARVRSDFLNGPRYRESDGSMRDFCEAEIRNLVHLDSPLDEMTLVDTLKRRLSGRIQQALDCGPDESIEEFLKYVGKLDRSYEREKDRIRYQEDYHNKRERRDYNWDGDRRDHYQNHGEDDRGRQDSRNSDNRDGSW